MRTDGNPRLIEFRSGLEVLPYRWPVALRNALIFVLSGVAWALLLVFVIVVGALAHGH